MSQPIHTTLVQTEGPHRITVEAAPTDGEWCRVFHWFIDHIMPDLRGGAVKVQLCICRNADRFTGLCSLSRGEIAAIPGDVKWDTTAYNDRSYAKGAYEGWTTGWIVSIVCAGLLWIGVSTHLYNAIGPAFAPKAHLLQRIGVLK